MGLTIHYALGAKNDADSAAIMGHLRQAALDLPFKEVGELIHLSGDAADVEQLPEGADEALRWTLISAAVSVEVGEGWSWFGGQRIRSRRSVRVAPVELFAFSAWPGEGCESMEVGLARYPEAIEANGGGRGSRGRSVKTRLGGWRWKSFTKTQYSSKPEYGGPMNFVRCHLLVVRMLDLARGMGLRVKVDDEGGYWRRRDVAALVREVGQWDAMIAALGGLLKDMAGRDGGTVTAEVFDRSDFEALEARGILMPEVARLAIATRRTVRARRTEAG